ncbi:MAG TPA: branched-chain amino acid ABC transporter permease [Candidatus Dormibacteraeota bacterium]|nr:branched-chain amino acid ABC transporter permease [Candidatus Dormibacteraeota bacterium]
MHEVLVTLGFALVTASILALSAVAFTLEYAVTNVANVSHGEILTAGAYAAYLVHQRTGSPLAAAVAAALAGGLVALAMHSAVIGPFIRFGASPTVVFIATLGMSFVIQNVLVIFFGAANVAYTLDPGAPQQIGPFLLTPLDVEIIASAIAITLALFLIISRTKFGKALRAVSQNRELARVTGINATRVAASTFFLAGLVAGYAGFVLAESVGSFNPYFGFGFFLITLTAAVAGGLGRAFGTLVGAVMVGLVLEFAQTVRLPGGGYVSASYNLAFAFAILAIVILVRPRGLFTNARRTVFE